MPTDRPPMPRMAQKALDIARSKGQKDYIKEIQEWLNANRAGTTN